MRVIATRPVLGRIDVEFAPQQLLAVELRDRFSGFGFAGKLHKGEPARTAGPVIAGQVDVDDLTRGGQKRGQLIGRCLKIQIPDKDFG